MQKKHLLLSLATNFSQIHKHTLKHTLSLRLLQTFYFRFISEPRDQQKLCNFPAQKQVRLKF